MAEYKKFEDIVRAFGAKKLTVTEAVDLVEQRKSEYTLGHMEPPQGLAEPYYAMRGELQRREKERMQRRLQQRENAPAEMVKCTCGHTVSRATVMSTSSGTSCPDCYDRMSA